MIQIITKIKFKSCFYTFSIVSKTKIFLMPVILGSYCLQSQTDGDKRNIFT